MRLRRARYGDESMVEQRAGPSGRPGHPSRVEAPPPVERSRTSDVDSGKYTSNEVTQFTKNNKRQTMHSDKNACKYD